MSIRKIRPSKDILRALALAFFIVGVCTAQTTPPDLTIPTLGKYSATAPYHCPKSAQILANTRDQMVDELLANSNYLNSGNSHANAIQALALLASVQPGDPNYSAVQSRLRTYARSLANRIPSGGDWNWDPAYQLVFLAEYYLLTSDSQVVPTINAFTLWLVETQSMWGTYGHAPSILYQDGSGRRISNGYGPVNSVGNIANLAIVLGKKALQAAYAVQAEYYSRMAIAGRAGVDVGHAGQELGLLWAALGAGMGGESAASGHFKQLLWRFDLSRRTNGSFTYDSRDGDYYSGGSTSDGTYLGNSAQYGVKGTAINHLHDQSTRWTDGQPISLTAGQKVPLLVEYYENTGSAVAKLKWTGPSFAGLNGEIIPQPYFFDSNSTGGPDTTPPVITAYYPADNATGVAHATDLVATFSENIVRGTGNITLKNLSDGTQTAIAVTDTTQVTISGATLTINPTALLVGGKNHAVRIDATAIDDTAGTKSFWIPASSSPADEGYHWNRNAKSYYLIGDALASEMIGLQADTTPPTISTYSPANNATGVAVGANLVATFSENIVRGTGNLTLRNLTDGTQTNIPVTDTAQVSISGAVLTINPTANLTSGKNYAVQIAATAIKDPATAMDYLRSSSVRSPAAAASPISD